MEFQDREWLWSLILESLTVWAQNERGQPLSGNWRESLRAVSAALCPGLGEARD